MGEQDNLPDFDRLYFTAPGFLKPDKNGVFYGFFGRRGGSSGGLYASLNCGPGSDDDPSDVMNNRRLVCELAGAGISNFYTLHQVHSDKCIVAPDGFAPELGRPQADALVSDTPGTAIGVLTADCAPVLFYGEKDNGAPVIGAAHAGWGGAFKGVLGSTYQALIDLGARRDTIRACVGPCIQPESYEVGEEFRKAFLDEGDANERFFANGARDGHFMFDLPGYCESRLSALGVEKVFVKRLDTYFNEEDFFSYRRATHRNEEDYGRQVSVISIRER